MTRIFAATVLIILSIGSADPARAGVFFWLMPLMVLFAVALIVDEATARAKRSLGQQ